MRIVLALAIIILLISGVVIGVAANQQPAINLKQTAAVADGVQLASLQAEPEGAAADPVAQDPPDGDEPDGGASEARQTADALMAGVQALLAEVEAAQAGELPAALPPIQDPYPVEPEEPVTDEELSPAGQLAAELVAGARSLLERLTGATAGEDGSDGAQPAPEAEGESLLDQVQSLLAQITGAEEAAEETAVQEWMPSQPDCNADPAPGVNWSNCDKSGIELDGANLQGANLMGTNFSGAALSNTDLSGAHLGGANFSEAELSSVMLLHSNLVDADFSSALLIFVDMSYANLSGADFTDSIILVVVARHSKFIEADFSRAYIIYADLSLSKFPEALFNDANILFDYFRESDMSDADFTGVTGAGIEFTEAKIPGMDLSGSDLLLVWFKGTTGEPTSSVDLEAEQIICTDGSYVARPLTTDAASLCDWSATPALLQTAVASTPDCSAAAAPGVNWSGCDKSGLSFVGVDLQDANLAGTDFSNSSFYLSDLRRASMIGANLDDATIVISNLRDADLSGATLNRAILQISNLVFANLSGANIADASYNFVTMWGSDLSKAGLEGTSFTYSDLSFANLNEAGAAGVALVFDFMRGANLANADFSGGSMNLVDLSTAQIEELDLSAETLFGNIWLKGANGVPTSSQDLTLQGTLICPAGDAVLGPLTTDAASLCQWKECWSGILDGDFEARSNAWYLPATEYTAEFTTDQANSPDWSVRTGIIDPQDNTFSFSSVRQTVTIPAGTDPAILTFYLYTQTDEPLNFLIPSSLEEAMTAKDANTALGGPGSNVGDAQWVIILDSMGRELLRPISMRSNTQMWEQYEVDLSDLVNPFNDRTIEVYFGTFNNGHGGVTGMYVDDVALGSCPGVPAPPPPQPPPQVCSDIILNGGFETEDTWMLPLTPFPANYSTDQASSGAQAMRTGIDDPNVNVESFSSAVQKVTIPADATEAKLGFYLYPQSTEAPDLLVPESMEAVMAQGARAMNYGDAQWAILLNQRGQQIERLVSMRSDDQTWSDYAFDLLPYKGHTILLYFSTYNNGWDGRTSMYVDDVTLNVCAPETTQPVMALTDLERAE